MSTKWYTTGIWKDLTGPMKYFKHILIDHEIYLKFFDGPQEIFLCDSFLIFLVIHFKKLCWPEQDNVQTSHQGDFKKTKLFKK